ncbi:MAG: GGDEF domain-containing protein [Phycisphaerales bacterium]|nr:GGDEF domain-containing protein [Phycisphaerales bacterium]
MNDQLLSRIRECPTLPSLPTIAIQVLDLAQRESVDIAEIARVISKDPALSSKILRTVNSSFYGRSQSIGTISHALVILGLQSVKTLVLGFSLVTTLAKDKGKGFKHLTFWRRSIYSATAARTIAGKIKLVQQEECFLAALMKDIGVLVFDQVLGDQYGAVCEKISTHSELPTAEQEAFELTHAQVSGMLAEQWKLPPLLSVPMAFHHDPEKVEDPSLRKLADLVYLSGICSDVFVDENAAGPIGKVRKFCQEKYQINEAECDALLDEIGRRTREMAPLFEINIGPTTSFEAILKKANEALVELTLRSQQQATTLQVQNQQLKVQATTDALTGLNNRATFDQFIARQFAASIRENKPLSLILLDVDKFKSINDKHGHPTGDQVLKFVGRLLKAAARQQDLAVRYGGEEMCIVLPATTRAQATTTAETIRRALAAKPVATATQSIPVTASFGVATLEPPFVFKESAQLIKAADLAVYAAKHAGRNCVRVFSPPKAQPKAA